MNIKDPIWRLNHLYKIVDKNAQLIRYRQNVIQAETNKFTSNRNIILKARQFGISTDQILKKFDRTIFNENQNTCIIADEQDSIKKLFRIPTIAYHSMHEDLRPPLSHGKGSKYEMFFPTINSRIYVDLESHGDTIHNLHVSEAALMKDKSRLDSTLQAVPIGGDVTLETTPKGMSWFYDEWMDQDSTFDKHFYPWFMFPPYTIESNVKIELSDKEIEFKKHAKKYFQVNISTGQILYRRFKQRELKEKFLEQYPEDPISCFLSSGNPAMDLLKVKQRLSEVEPVLEHRECIEIYKPYVPGNLYAIGCDTAEGISGDYCVASLHDVSTREQCAVMRGRFKPFDYAHKLKEFAGLYQHGGTMWPQIGVERNNHGHAVLLELQEHIGYPNLYVHQDEKLGWLTDRVSRPIMLDTFIDGVENGGMKLNHVHTLKECLTLINNDGKIEAEEGKNDDCIIAAAIALQLCIKSSVDIYNNIDKLMRV